MNAYAAIARLYDALTANVNYSAYAEYIVRKFKENQIEGTILDAGCGTGVMLEHFKKHGFDMIGVDISSDMLASAARKQTGALLLQQDLRCLDLFGTISGAVSTLDVMNHLPSENDLTIVFSRIALFMEAKGILIFDINLPYKHNEVLANNCFVFELSKEIVVWQNRLEKTRVLINLDVFTECGDNKYTRTSESFYEYTYSLERIKALLEEDYDILEIVDGESFCALSDTSERAVVCARKKGHRE